MTCALNGKVVLYEFNYRSHSYHCKLQVIVHCLQLLLFGGHGTGGWLSRYDIYYNDSVVLDRGKCFMSSTIKLHFDS